MLYFILTGSISGSRSAKRIWLNTYHLWNSKTLKVQKILGINYPDI